MSATHSSERERVAGLALFLAADTMAMASLISAYVLLRTNAATWPDGVESLPWLASLLHTAVALALLLPVVAPRFAFVNAPWDSTLTSVLIAALVVGEGVLAWRAGVRPDEHVYFGFYYVWIGMLAAHHIAAAMATIARSASSGTASGARSSARLFANYRVVLHVLVLLLLYVVP